MIGFNKRRNTLEQETYHYELQDVAEPTLYRDLFPYQLPPMIAFNHRLVPMNPPDEVWMTDTTFRDGQQARPPFTVKQIVDLYTMLHRLGGPNGMIRMSEFFVYTEAQIAHAIEAIQKIRNEGLKYVDIRRDVQDRYNEGIQKRMKHMVWGGCKSWYLNPDGSNHSLYPGFAAEYVLRARHFKPAEYEIVK